MVGTGALVLVGDEPVLWLLEAGGEDGSSVGEPVCEGRVRVWLGLPVVGLCERVGPFVGSPP